MLRVHHWDEIGAEWTTTDLDLPDCRDGVAISRALDVQNGAYEPDDDVEEGDEGWVVTKSTDTGDLLVIEASSDRGHQSILIVNYRDEAGD